METVKPTHMLPEVDVAASRCAKLRKDDVEPVEAKSKVGGDGSNLAGLLNDIETPMVATPSTGTIASNWAFPNTKGNGSKRHAACKDNEEPELVHWKTTNKASNCARLRGDGKASVAAKSETNSDVMS